MKTKKKAKARAQNSAGNSAKTVRGNPAKIRPYQFKPGQSGNPGGRPKGLISDASRDWLKRIDEQTGRSNAELVAEAQGDKALEGETNAYCALRDTTEGRPAQTQQHEIISNTPVKVEIDAPDLITTLRHIYGLSAQQPAKADGVPENMDRGPSKTQDRNQGA